MTVLCQRGGGPDAVRLRDDLSVDAQTAALQSALAGQDIVFLHNVLTMPFSPALTEALWR